MPWKKGNRFKTVPESEAPPEIRAIYEDMKDVLGVPQINIILQAYAGFPEFFKMQWQRLRPIVSSKEFFDFGNRLCADAFTRVHNYFKVPDFCSAIDRMHFSEDAKEELSEVVNLFQYYDPLLLLITSAQQQAFENPVGSGAPPVEAKSHPSYEHPAILVEQEAASQEVQKLFEEVRHFLKIPIVPTDVRAIARWPDFLRQYWVTLHPLLESPVYQQCMRSLMESAWKLAQELPGTFETTMQQISDAGVDEADAASLVRMTEAFRSALAGTLLNVSIAKIGLEGGNLSLEKRTPESEMDVHVSSPTQAA